MKLWVGLLLTASMYAQNVVVAATATATAPPPSAATHTRVIPGESLTYCNGNTSYLGRFSETQLSCTTTSTPSKTVAEPDPASTLAVGIIGATQRRRTFYTLLESDEAIYVFSCFEKWKWNSCPEFAIGEKLSVVRQKSRLVLASATQSFPMLHYLASQAKPKQ